MIELNAGGTEILERYAAIFLTKILGGVDPNFLDVRWPAGAGLGALAYNYDGAIFTCDEGRMLDAMGDDAFLGSATSATSRYRDVVGHETVRAVAIASNLDGRPTASTAPTNRTAACRPATATRPRARSSDG
jgi:uncharacterized protein